MLNLNEFSHNHHPPRVKMLAKYIRRGISVLQKLLYIILRCLCEIINYKISKPESYTDTFRIRHSWAADLLPKFCTPIKKNSGKENERLWFYL